MLSHALRWSRPAVAAPHRAAAAWPGWAQSMRRSARGCATVAAAPHNQHGDECRRQPRATSSLGFGLLAAVSHHKLHSTASSHLSPRFAVGWRRAVQSLSLQQQTSTAEDEDFSSGADADFAALSGDEMKRSYSSQSPSPPPGDKRTVASADTDFVPQKSPLPPPKRWKGPFYAIWKGLDGFTGITETWPQCSDITNRVNGVRYKKFSSIDEACEFFRSWQPEINNIKYIDASEAQRNVAIDDLRKEYGRANTFPGPKRNRSLSNKPPAAELQRYSLTEDAESLVPSVVVYTDGACTYNGVGKLARAGYGVWFADGDRRNVSARLPGEPQTNNRAEIMGVLSALEVLYEEALRGDTAAAEVRTDSAYVQKGLTQWIENWRKNDWRTTAGKAVLNKDLWLRLDRTFRRTSRLRKLSITWVKGHALDAGNNAADRLAVRGAEQGF